MFEYVVAVIVPGAMAALFFGATVFLPERVRMPAGALALGICAAAGFVSVLGFPGIPPRDATQWLVVAAVGLGIAGAVETHGKSLAVSSRVAVNVVLLCVIAAVVLRPLIVQTWPAAKTLLWLCLLPAIAVAIKESYLYLLARLAWRCC